MYYGLGDDDGAGRRRCGRTTAGSARRPNYIVRARRPYARADPERVRQFADAGFTDLVLDPTIPSLDQVDRLADVVL